MPKKSFSILTPLPLGLCLAMLLSCQAKSPSGTSSLNIHFPAASQMPDQIRDQAKGKVQSLATKSYDFSKVCYSANISGVGIPAASQNSSCDIQMGIFSGFVAPGGSVSISIPQGSSRSLQIFTYTRASASDPCPTSAQSFQGLDLSKVVRVGEVRSFDALDPQVTVNVDVYAPADGVNLLTQYSLPSACYPKPPAPGSANILAGRGQISGGNFIVIGSVGGQKNETLLLGGQYKMRLSRRVQ